MFSAIPRISSVCGVYVGLCVDVVGNMRPESTRIVSGRLCAPIFFFCSGFTCGGLHGVQRMYGGLRSESVTCAHCTIPLYAMRSY